MPVGAPGLDAARCERVCEGEEMARIGAPFCCLVAVISANASAQSLLDWARTGTPEQIREAISAGMNVNEKAVNGMTPLMLAAINCEYPEVISAIAKAGADLEARNREGKTALVLACQWISTIADWSPLFE
jgi:hypothetical protein